MFREKNDYPKLFNKQVLNEVKKKYKASVNNVREESQVSISFIFWYYRTKVRKAILLLK